MTKLVADLMTRDVVSVTPETRVEAAESLARERGIQHLLVVEANRLGGVVCRCDLERARARAAVGTCVRREVVTIGPSAPPEEAAAVMRDRAVGCLPVVAGEVVLGIVSRADLLRTGLGLDQLSRRCATCGGVHGLPAAGSESPVAFCRDCLECPRTELGGGD